MSDPPRLLKLPRANFALDVPAALRDLADSLERDVAEYGEGFVLRVTVVVRSSGQEPRVFGYGDNPPSQAFLDLHAGAQQLLSMKSPGRN